MTISPEQALEVLKKLNLISLEGELHGTVVMNADQLTAFASAVLAEYLGEPVAYISPLAQKRLSQRGIGSIARVPGRKCTTPLYAPRKE